MKKKFIIVAIITLVINLVLIGVVNCDGIKGWQGYGVYNLNNSDITSFKESANITLKQDKVIYKNELIIKNNSSDNQEVILGIPSSSVISMYTSSNGKTIRNYKMGSKSVERTLKDVNGIPQVDNWRAFNFWQKPGEITVISLTVENSANIDSDGVYALNYLHDIDMKSRVNSNMVELGVILSDYEPYNLLSMEGPDTNLALSSGGDFNWKMDAKNLQKISVKYQFTEEKAINSILKNHNNSIERLVNLYKSKNYGDVINAADVALKNSTEESTINFAKYILSEGYRKMNMGENYISLSADIDLNNISPKELIYKILIDRINYYHYKSDLIKMDEEIKKIEEICDNKSVTNYIESIKSNKNDINISHNKDSKNDSKKNPEFYIEAFTEMIYENKFMIIGVLLFIFILGFVIGRISKRDRRNRRNNYLFRR